MRSKKVISAIVVCAVAAIVAGWAFYKTMLIEEEKAKRLEYDMARQAALNVNRSGNLDESVRVYNDLVERAPTSGDANTAKRFLAANMFNRNKGDDREQAVAIYRGIIMDERAHLRQRALAVDELIGLYVGTHDPKVFDLIFAAEPLAKFNEENDRELAVRRAFEFSDELFPMSLANFRITDWYVQQLMKPGLTAEQNAEYVSELRKRTEKGELLMPAFLAMGNQPSRVGYAYQLNALARAALAFYTDKDYSKSVEAYKKGLAALAPEDTYTTYDMALFLRFHYAAQLTATPNNEWKAQAKELIVPIVNRPEQFANRTLTFDEFLRNEMGKEHDGHAHKKDLIRLQTLFPEFKSFLLSRGVEY